MGIALRAAVSAVAFVAEHAAVILRNVRTAVAAFRMASLAVERRHFAPRTAAVWRQLHLAG